MQKRRLGGLDRLVRDARRDSDRVEPGLQNSLDRKKSRRDALLADGGERVGSVADGGEMMVLGRDIALHAEDLDHVVCVKGARLAVQVEPERADQYRHQADA